MLYHPCEKFPKDFCYKVVYIIHMLGKLKKKEISTFASKMGVEHGEYM